MVLIDVIIIALFGTIAGYVMRLVQEVWEEREEDATN